MNQHHSSTAERENRLSSPAMRHMTPTEETVQRLVSVVEIKLCYVTLPPTNLAQSRYPFSRLAFCCSRTVVLKHVWHNLANSPADSRRVWVDDTQAEGRDDGCIHRGALLIQHLEPQRGTVCHVRYHGTLIEDLTRDKHSDHKKNG